MQLIEDSRHNLIESKHIITFSHSYFDNFQSTYVWIDSFELAKG